MNLEERLSKLERQNRRLKAALVSIIAFFTFGIVLTGICFAIQANMQHQRAQHELAKAQAAVAQAIMRQMEVGQPGGD